jgi:beta-glucosidase-like glycosyl hydrolase
VQSNAPMHGVVKRYRDLVVWQQAMDLVVEAYGISALFPRDEKYGLVQQLRRAAVSIPSNIAEGHGRDHLGDYPSPVDRQWLTNGAGDASLNRWQNGVRTEGP